jgi:phytoene synthase
VSGRLRWELRATWLGGTRILDRLARQRFDVFKSRPTLGWADAGVIAVRSALLAAQRRHQSRRPDNAAVTRKTSFYYSFLVLPAPQRKAITAVFDFCRAVDDAVDLETDQERARAALVLWRREVGNVFEARSPETPQGQALQPFVKPFHLPRPQFDALVDGVEMDASPRRYQTFAELEPYCHRVGVCGWPDVRGDLRLSRAGRAGLRARPGCGTSAHQHSSRRRRGLPQRPLYLPLEDLARFGCTEDDVRAEVENAGQGVRSPKMRSVLEHQATRARVFFSRATRGASIQ